MANLTDAEMRAELGRALELLQEVNAIATRLAAQPNVEGYEAMLWDEAPYTSRGWLLNVARVMDAGGDTDAFRDDIEQLERGLAKADDLAAEEARP